jgi:hypothetical protein
MERPTLDHVAEGCRAAKRHAPWTRCARIGVSDEARLGMVCPSVIVALEYVNAHAARR